MKNLKVEATVRNEAPIEAENRSGSGDIKGGTDICGETWTSISSSLAITGRIWNLP